MLEPADRFLIGLRHPTTDEVQPCKVMLGCGISLLCQWPPLFHGRGIVATFVSIQASLKVSPYRNGGKDNREEKGYAESKRHECLAAGRIVGSAPRTRNRTDTGRGKYVYFVERWSKFYSLSGKRRRFVMAHITMDHGVSRCFDTKLAPPSRFTTLQRRPAIEDSHSLFYFSSRIAACTLALSSGVTSRIPCCLACSMAFFRTSSSVFPRTTCLHPDDGSTLAHSMTLPMVEAPFCSPVRCEVDRGTRDKEA